MKERRGQEAGQRAVARQRSSASRTHRQSASLHARGVRRSVRGRTACQRGRSSADCGRRRRSRRERTYRGMSSLNGAACAATANERCQYFPLQTLPNRWTAISSHPTRRVLARRTRRTLRAHFPPFLQSSLCTGLPGAHMPPTHSPNPASRRVQAESTRRRTGTSRSSEGGGRLRGRAGEAQERQNSQCQATTSPASPQSRARVVEEDKERLARFWLLPRLHCARTGLISLSACF